MNPLAQMIGSASAGTNFQSIQNVKQMFTAINAMSNPQAALMHVARSNPQISELLQMCQGRDPKSVFNDQCKQHGLDPDAAIKQIRSMM